MADVVVRFVSDADQLLDDLRDVDSASRVAAKGVNLVGAALVAGAAATLTMTQRVADLRNELTDMAARTGISRRELAGLRFAAEASGGSLGELEGVLRKVTAEGLNLEETVATLQGIQDPTERAAKAMELLGEEGGRLVQVLGNSSIDSFADFVEEFGDRSGPDAVKAAAEWQQNLTILQTLLEGMTGEAAPLALLNDLIIDFGAGAVFIQELTAAFTDLSVTTDEAFQLATERARLFRESIDEIRTPVQAVGRDFDFYIKQELGILGEDTIVFKQGIDDVAKATKAMREEWAKVREELDAITFGEAASEMRQVIEVTDPLTGKTRELAIGYAQADTNLQSLAGTMSEDGMAAFQGLTYATQEQVDQSQKSALSWGEVSTQISATSDIMRGLGELAAFAGEQAKEGSKAAQAAAKVAFAASKAAAVGDVIVKTAQSIMAALVIPPPAGPILAGINAATGAASLATVLATSFGGGGSTPTGPAGGGAAGAAAAAAGGAAMSGAKPGEAMTDANVMRRVASTGGTMYRHRDLDVVAADGYPGSAFDGGIGYTGQRRQRVA